MATEAPKDTPFGLEPNVAAGLAYLLSIVGGIIMLAGGGTNKFVKWSACQSIVLFALYILAWIAVAILDGIGFAIMHLFWIPVALFLYWVVFVAFTVAWIVTWITGFQGKQIRLPFVGNLTQQVFGSQLG